MTVAAMTIISLPSPTRRAMAAPLRPLLRLARTTPHSILTRTFIPICPEWSPSFWGLTGIFLTTSSTLLPCWASISLLNVCVRTSMIPLVLRGAKTSVSFGKVAPEVQYLIGLFRRDFGGLRGRDETATRAQVDLLTVTLRSLRGIFKLHRVNLLDIFKSPMLQIPFFWYFALDLRKIIHGSDPQLAQQLVDSSFLWITDLTEPDPSYGLPVLTGLLLYLNVETAVGRRALSGEITGRSTMATVLRDFFQSLAIFMPSFMGQQPAGVQIYLATSMVFTLMQSIAMRNDGVRGAVGLPPVNSKPKGMEEGIYVKEFMERMRERQEAKARGEFVPGEGVLKVGAAPPVLGRRRKSSILMSGDSLEDASSQTSVMIGHLPLYTLSSLLVNSDLLTNATRPIPLLPRSMANPSSFFPPNAQLPSMSDMPNPGERTIEMAPSHVLAERDALKKRADPIDLDRIKSRRDRHGGRPGKKRK